MSIILVGGGSRSGKSRHAIELARRYGPRLAFIATAEPGDDEMRERIAKHREDRGPEFTTFEEPLDLAARLEETGSRFDAVIVDCLTLWLSNVLIEDRRPIGRECERLVRTASEMRTPAILVTNEVGCGIVPEHALARRFRDEAGRLNQIAASAAESVIWMVFGIPLRVR